MKNHSYIAETLSLIALGLLLSLPSDAAAQASSKSLQGVWRGVRYDSGTIEKPGKSVKLELTIQGNQVKARRLPEGDIGTGNFTLSADGKTIDAHGTSSNFKGNLYQGIIKVEGDTLYWCTTAGGGKTQTRPESFTAGSGKYLIVVKREK